MAQASVETFKHTVETFKHASQNGESGLSATKRAVGKNARAPLCQKEKEQSCLSKAPDREAGESQGEGEPHLGQRQRDQSGSMERKEWILQ